MVRAARGAGLAFHVSLAGCACKNCANLPQTAALLLPTAKAFDGLSPIMCSPRHHKSRHERTIVWGCMVSKATEIVAHARVDAFKTQQPLGV